jgi:hypothetical protein
VLISSPTDLLEVLLQPGRQRPIEILGDVGDSKEILPKPTLFSWRLIGNQHGFRFAGLGDDDFLADGGAVDKLGEVCFRVLEVDGIGHCAPAPLHTS